MNKETNPVANILTSLLSIVIVFGAINGLLWACQEQGSQQSKAEYEEKKAEIESLKSRIEVCKSELDSFKLVAVNNTLEPEAYNRYTAVSSDCKNLINKYNDLVPIVNNLGKQASQRIYLIPLVGRGSRGSH